MFFDGIGIGFEKNMVSEKVSVLVSKIFGIEKVSVLVSEKNCIEKNMNQL